MPLSGFSCFFLQAEDGIRDLTVTGVQTCALPIVLADTWDKSGGNLFDYWDEVAVERFCRRVQQGGRRVALAGSLSGASLTAAARCRPDLVAVRAAACDGGRLGGVAASRVSAIRRQFESARSQSHPAAAAGGGGG